jgi:2,4-dienoyl-CoA reductase-like NADH-dependent reductase (Old Yellow Enzyme family)
LRRNGREECEIKDLFEETKIGNLTLQNRFVRSATWDGMAQDDATVTERLIILYSQLAKGKLGLICSGYCYVNPHGKAIPRQIELYKDELISSLKKLTEETHKQQNGFPNAVRNDCIPILLFCSLLSF